MYAIVGGMIFARYNVAQYFSYGEAICTLDIRLGDLISGVLVTSTVTMVLSTRIVFGGLFGTT